MVSLQSAENALKSFYLDAVKDSIDTKTSPFLAKVEQSTADVYGKDVKKVIRLGFHGGVVSGTAAATISAQILAHVEFGWPQIVSLSMSALVAGLTVGGKAIGKTFAMNSCTDIIYLVGQFIHWLRQFPEFFKGKKKKS